MLLPVDLLGFLARKVNNLKLTSKVILGAFGCGAYYFTRPAAKHVSLMDPVSKSGITDYVYFDLAADNVYLGRILIGLYGSIHPLTCENFVQMCKGYQVGSRLIGYLNTRVTHVLPGRGIVMGDLFHPGGTLDSCTIYGRSMPEEGFDTKFVQEGDVAMLSSNNDTGVSSRFLITLSNNPGLGRRFVVIGTVVKGMKLVRSLKDEQTVQTVPKRDLRVIGCGVYRGPQDGPRNYFNKEASALASSS